MTLLTPEIPAVPRPAATVAILRDGAAGIEVWLMRRNSSMAFAAGMQAFPGGAVESADHDALVPWAGTDPEEFGAVLDLDTATARALVSAAVRETFEECGVLFTAGARPTHDEAEAARLALLDGSVRWPDLLRAAGMAVDASALVAWSRWITPDWSPRRFDAYFFLAALADATEPRWIDGEADRAGWHDVGEAIAAHERGELPMLPPTIGTLRQIALHRDVAAALAARPLHVKEESG